MSTRGTTSENLSLDPARGHEFLGRTAWQLAQTPSLIQTHVHGETREALDLRPRDDVWSQSEVIAHLADVEVIVFQARLAQVLAGEPLTRFDPLKRAEDVPYRAMDPFRSLHRFRQDRTVSIQLIARLTPEDLERRTVHSALGEITLANLLADWVVHDLSHLWQLMITAAQMYLTATGPWRKAFAHLEIRPEG